MKTTKIITVINEAINRENAEINARLLRIITQNKKVLSRSDEDFLVHLGIRRYYDEEDISYIGPNGIELRILRGDGTSYLGVRTATTRARQTGWVEPDDKDLQHVDFYSFFTRPDLEVRHQYANKTKWFYPLGHKDGQPIRYALNTGDKLHDVHNNLRVAATTRYGLQPVVKARDAVKQRTGFDVEIDPQTGKHKVIKTR